MVDDIDAVIGAKLRAFRLRADLSVDALAELTGLRPATVARYEAGRLRVPVGRLTRLATLLRVSVGEFFT